MVQKNVVIAAEVGLHARPAADFVKLATAADSVTIGRPEGEPVNGKSVLSVLTLGLGHKEEAIVTVEGSDAADHLERIVALLESPGH